MNKDQIEAILASIAKNNRTTVENVRKEIQLAMDVAQQSNDPNIQSLWHSIPSAGKHVTIEEFLNYCLSQMNSHPPHAD